MSRTKFGGVVVAILAVVCFVGAYAQSQEQTAAAKDKPEKPGAGGMDESMMKSFMEAAAVGPQHKMLEPMAGTFKYTNKFKMDPSSEWVVSEGNYEGELCMDGRFLMTHVTGPMMGMQFEGMGALGYDNTLKKYVAAWIDNMGTGIMRSEGTADASGKTITFEGDMVCPITKGPKPYKYEYELKGNDEFTMRWWAPAMSDGKMFESMVITYTRAK